MTRSSAKSLVVIVTGATEGIGREIALRLASDQAKLVLAARNLERLNEIVGECQALGADVLGVTTDIADKNQCQHLIEQAVQRFDGIDALINNAGITMWTLFEDLTDLSVLDTVMRVNYLGSAYMTHFALPHLRKSRGRLVAVSSVAGLTGVPTRSAYSASKHAMFGFFESLRVELKNSGVSVTLVAPDFVHSEIHKRALTADGSPLNETPFKTQKLMTAKECAALTVDAMLKRKRLIITSFRGKFVRLLRIVAPGWVDRIAYNAINRAK